MFTPISDSDLRSFLGSYLGRKLGHISFSLTYLISMYHHSHKTLAIEICIFSGSACLFDQQIALPQIRF